MTWIDQRELELLERMCVALEAIAEAIKPTRTLGPGYPRQTPRLDEMPTHEGGWPAREREQMVE